MWGLRNPNKKENKKYIEKGKKKNNNILLTFLQETNDFLDTLNNLCI